MDIFERNKDELDVKMLSPLVWAYVGDSVYELFIRTHLVNNSNSKPHKLHLETIKYVKAESQANILNKIWDKLTEEEQILKIIIFQKMEMLLITAMLLVLRL